MNCTRETNSTKSVTFIWPETAPNFNASFVCPNNPRFKVIRECSAEGRWREFDVQGCGVLSTNFSDVLMESEKVI